jgi:lauroyl/myristoyl acyltransferase
MGKLGVRGALREAVARLRSGETILMFPDAFAIPAREGALACRVGRLDVAYPRGAVWLARQTDATVQGAVVRARGDGHEIWWGTPRPGPATHAAVTEAVQELLDHSVARDPAAWLAWFTEDAASGQVGS